MTTSAATAEGLPAPELAGQQSDELSETSVNGSEPRQNDRRLSARSRLLGATVFVLITCIELAWLATMTYGVKKLIG